MNLMYGKKEIKQAGRRGPVAAVGGFFVSIIMAVSSLFQKNIFTRLVCVVGFTTFSIATSVYLMPKAEYLPQGNQNIIMNILVPPPGYSSQKRHEVADNIYGQLKPYMDEDGRDGFPRIKNMFFLSADIFTFFGTTCVEEHETEVGKLIPLLTRIIHSIPGMFGVSIQPGIFESELGKGRTVDVNISGKACRTSFRREACCSGRSGRPSPRRR